MIGAKATRHSKYVFFQMAEAAVTRNLFAAILDRIKQLVIPPPVLVSRIPAKEQDDDENRLVPGAGLRGAHREDRKTTVSVKR